VNWGTSITIPFTSNTSGNHAFVCIGTSGLYMVWSNQTNVAYATIYGTAIITVERTNTNVIVTTQSNNSITAFYIT